LNGNPSADRFAIAVAFVDKNSTRTLADDVAQEITSFASWDAAYFFVAYNPGHTPGAAPQDTLVLASGVLLPGPGNVPRCPRALCAGARRRRSLGGALCAAPLAHVRSNRPRPRQRAMAKAANAAQGTRPTRRPGPRGSRTDQTSIPTATDAV